MSFVFSPEGICHLFNSWFPPFAGPIFCQVANRSQDAVHLRTMHLYEISQENGLVFLSHTKTQKWENWQQDAYSALCFFNQNFGQILVEGTVSLKTKETDDACVQRYWDSLPEAVRRIYQPENPQTNAVPDCFGVICVHPILWESLELDKEDYLNSKRTVYRYKENIWKSFSIKVTS